MSEALMKGILPLQHNLVQGFYPIKQPSAQPNAHLQLLCWIMNMTMSSCGKPSVISLGFSCVNMLVRPSPGAVLRRI